MRVRVGMTDETPRPTTGRVGNVCGPPKVKYSGGAGHGLSERRPVAEISCTQFDIGAFEAPYIGGFAHLRNDADPLLHQARDQSSAHETACPSYQYRPFQSHTETP